MNPVAEILALPGFVSGTLVGFGICALDHIVVVDEFPGDNDKTEASDSEISPGGPICNALAAAHSTGMSTRLITILGEDSAGRLIRDRLRKFGIQTEWMINDKTCRTAQAYIRVDKRTGNRSVVLDRLKTRMLLTEDLHQGMLSEASALITDGRWYETMKGVILQAANLNIPVFLDAGSLREGIDFYLSHVDCVIASRVFASQFARTDDMRSALLKIKNHSSGEVAITLGNAGVLALDGNRIIQVPAYPMDVRDTTGAGDVFHGVFAAYRYGSIKKSFIDCLTIASTAAAFACGELGGFHPDLPIEKILHASARFKNSQGQWYSEVTN